MKKNNKKGFTLAELLIVVAIIAVLVAISIPIFTAQLEKSREAVDAANIRSAYAELVADYLTESAAASKTVAAKQTQENWSITPDFPAALGTVPAVTAPGSYTISIDADGNVSVSGS